jgi:hypothetical protein
MTVARRARWLALATLLGTALLLGTAPTAHAQSSAADALFREGRALIKAGKLAEGCAKLEASEKLDSSVGTLLNLGDCREKLGELASAWGAFHEAEELAKRTGNDQKRAQEAKRRALRLEPDLASITVQIAPKTKHDGLVIKRDGEVVERELWGTAVVVDPGRHTVVAEAPGFQPWTSEVSVGKGSKRWVVVPSLDPIEPPTPVEPPKPAAEPPPVAAKPVEKRTVEKRTVERRTVENKPNAQKPVEPTPTTKTSVVAVVPAPEIVVEEPTWNTTRGIAVAAGVVGVAAIVTGMYFGNESNDKQSQSNVICPGTICDDPEGLRLNDDAQDDALAANILFAAGGAAVVTGTVLWFVGRPETTVITPTISGVSVGASLTGRF